MSHISIISSSIRIGRNSHRVALYFENYLKQNKLATSEILDLKAYNFPLFEERLQFQDNPADNVLDFAERIRSSDGIIIITPEYNGGYPASLKNVIDLLYEEWHHKPIAIITASSGQFGGMQVMLSLQFTLWKIKAWTIPAMFPVPAVQDAFDETGVANDKQNMDKMASAFVKELLFCIKADKQN